MCSKTKALQEILKITQGGFPTPEIMEIEKIANNALTKRIVFKESDFDNFWKCYPRRKGADPKQEARKAFEKAIQEDDVELIIKAASNYEEEDARFIPQARTWLNQKRYLDVPDKPKIDYNRKNLMDFNGDYKAYKEYMETIK